MPIKFFPRRKKSEEEIKREAEEFEQKRGFKGAPEEEGLSEGDITDYSPAGAGKLAAKKGALGFAGMLGMLAQKGAPRATRVRLGKEGRRHLAEIRKEQRALKPGDRDKFMTQDEMMREARRRSQKTGEAIDKEDVLKKSIKKKQEEIGEKSPKATELDYTKF